MSGHSYLPYSSAHMAASGDPGIQSVNKSESNSMKLDSKKHQHDKSHVYLRQVC